MESLIGQDLHPGVGSFNLPNHVSNLVTDDRMINKTLAKCLAFVSILYSRLDSC